MQHTPQRMISNADAEWFDETLDALAQKASEFLAIAEARLLPLQRQVDDLQYDHSVFRDFAEAAYMKSLTETLRIAIHRAKASSHSVRSEIQKHQPQQNTQHICVI